MYTHSSSTFHHFSHSIAKASVPRQPHSLTGQTNSTSITLSWLPPLPVPGEPLTNQTSVSGYTVTTRNDQNTFLPSTETSFVVNNLTAGIEYNFSVAAHNAFGVGEPAVINITIPTQAPPTGTLIYKPLQDRFHKVCIEPFLVFQKVCL